MAAHPELPLIARALDFDIEIRDLTKNHDDPMAILKFPFVQPLWKIV
jgi:hypothetical protein